MDENDLSYRIIGAAIEVHRELGGPGLLEDIYEEAFQRQDAEARRDAKEDVAGGAGAKLPFL